VAGKGGEALACHVALCGEDGVALGMLKKGEVLGGRNRDGERWGYSAYESSSQIFGLICDKFPVESGRIVDIDLQQNRTSLNLEERLEMERVSLNTECSLFASHCIVIAAHNYL
jgi:hypothetical protein